jgi:hypothetical protein
MLVQYRGRGWRKRSRCSQRGNGFFRWRCTEQGSWRGPFRQARSRAPMTGQICCTAYVSSWWHSKAPAIHSIPPQRIDGHRQIRDRGAILALSRIRAPAREHAGRSALQTVGRTLDHQRTWEWLSGVTITAQRHKGRHSRRLGSVPIIVSCRRPREHLPSKSSHLGVGGVVGGDLTPATHVCADQRGVGGCANRGGGIGAVCAAATTAASTTRKLVWLCAGLAPCYRASFVGRATLSGNSGQAGTCGLGQKRSILT